MDSTEVAPNSYTAAKDSVQDTFDALTAASRACEEAMKQFGTGVIGDHARVTYNSKDFTVTDYEHD